MTPQHPRGPPEPVGTPRGDPQHPRRPQIPGGVSGTPNSPGTPPGPLSSPWPHPGSSRAAAGAPRRSSAPDPPAPGRSWRRARDGMGLGGGRGGAKAPPPGRAPRVRGLGGEGAKTPPKKCPVWKEGDTNGGPGGGKVVSRVSKASGGPSGSWGFPQLLGVHGGPQGSPKLLGVPPGAGGPMGSRGSPRLLGVPLCPGGPHSCWGPRGS